MRGLLAWHVAWGCVVDRGHYDGCVAGGNRVEDSDVSFFARITRTYNPGVTFWGVAHHVYGNTIHNAPHQAMFGNGNDHVFDSNYVYDVCFEVGSGVRARRPREEEIKRRLNEYDAVRSAWVVRCFCSIQATDSGAWYMGRSWIQRGNVVINNRFERVRTTEVTTLG